MTKNQIKIAVGVLIVVLIACLMYFKGNIKGTSVVYLATGEVYVGDLTLWPKMELKNGYILTTVADPADAKKTNFQLNPLNEALWAPEHLYLNRKHIVFYGPIVSNSEIAKALAEKAAKAQ